MIAQGVGLGTFPFSNVFAPVSEEQASSIVRKFLSLGGRYIQTAPYYAGVDSLMARILKTVPRDDYALGTLCVKGRDSISSGTYSSIINQCEDSLRTLQIDYVDLYLTSTTRAKDAPFSETMRALEDLREQGKIREFGVCNVTLPQLEEYRQSGHVSHVQNRFSLIDRTANLDVREYCAAENLSLVPYNVIEWGLLTEKQRSSWTLREGDLRTTALPIFQDGPRQLIQSWVREELAPLADGYGVPIEALAIHWALKQPQVAFCPVGATSPEQIESSMRAFTLDGRPEVVPALDRAYEKLVDDVRARYEVELSDYLRNSYGTF